MKITVTLDGTGEYLDIVHGRNLEDCLAKAVKKTGRLLKHLKDYPNGTVAVMGRRQKQSL